MDVEAILFDTIYAETPPERHGQLCPVWTLRRYPKKQGPCDCWVADRDHRLARKLVAALAAAPPTEGLDRRLSDCEDALSTVERAYDQIDEAVRSSAEDLIIAFRRWTVSNHGFAPSEDDFRDILATAAALRAAATHEEEG